MMVWYFNEKTDPGLYYLAEMHYGDGCWRYYVSSNGKSGTTDDLNHAKMLSRGALAKARSRRKKAIKGYQKYLSAPGSMVFFHEIPVRQVKTWKQHVSKLGKNAGLT